jgi:hypothetical protein
VGLFFVENEPLNLEVLSLATQQCDQANRIGVNFYTETCQKVFIQFFFLSGIRF